MEYPYDKPASAEPRPQDQASPADGGVANLPPVLSPLLIAAFAFGVVDLLYVPIGSAIARNGPNDAVVFLMIVVAGPLAAQFGVLPAWLVWGQRPFWQRLLIHWALAAGLVAAWSLGMFLSGAGRGSYLWREFAALPLILPAVSLAIEAPLWITRQFLGWRIGSVESPPERPLAIRDFLWGMAIVSVALAFVRAADAFVYPQGPGSVWSIVAIAAGVSSVASLFVMLPLTWFLLRLSKPGRAIIAALIYALVGGGVLLGVTIGIAGRPPDLRPVAGLFLLFYSLTGSIAAALGLARGMGYRLIVGKSSDVPAKTDVSEKKQL